MFIDRAMNPGHALQRSAMFPAMVRETGLRFAPMERGGIFWGRPFYKHYVPTGRGTLYSEVLRSFALALRRLTITYTRKPATAAAATIIRIFRPFSLRYESTRSP